VPAAKNCRDDVRIDFQIVRRDNILAGMVFKIVAYFLPPAAQVCPLPDRRALA
jgi:hypothetical protein